MCEEQKQPMIEPEISQQYIYKEILCDPSDLDCMGVTPKGEAEFIIEEALIVARQLLYRRVLELANEFMTEHQKKVFVLMLKEKTYHEIATILCDNYSSSYSGYTAISHAIKGQLNKQHGTYHGGLEKKLRKTCNKDDYCLEILEWIHRIADDSETALQFLYKYDETFTLEIEKKFKI